jgi:hypothetical protein
MIVLRLSDLVLVAGAGIIACLIGGPILAFLL